MVELKYQCATHDHKPLLAKVSARRGFMKANDALTLAYQVAGQVLRARSRAGMSRDAMAERTGTTRSVISRLESAGEHAPSLAALKRCASSVGCELQIFRMRHKATCRSCQTFNIRTSFNIEGDLRVAPFTH